MWKGVIDQDERSDEAAREGREGEVRTRERERRKDEQSGRTNVGYSTHDQEGNWKKKMERSVSELRERKRTVRTHGNAEPILRTRP